MDIARIGVMPNMTAQTVTGVPANDVASQFDAIFYRLLLQTVHWTSGISGGHNTEQALFGGMVTDFFAQEAARQQNGFGAMSLNRIDQEGKGKT